MKKSLPQKRKAQFNIFLSGILMGNVGLFILGLNNLSTNAIVALRGLFGALIILPILLLKKKMGAIKILFGAHPWLIILQSFAGPLLSFCYFFTIQKVGYGVAAFLLRTGPIFSVLFMWVLLHRVPDKRDQLGFFISMVGILLLTKPWSIEFSSSANYIGLAIGLLSGVLLGASNTFRIMIFDNMPTLDHLDEDISNSREKPVSKQTNSKDLIYFSLSLVFLETLVMFVIFTLLDFSYFSTMEPIHWLIALGLGMLSTVIPFFLRNIALPHDHAGDVLIFSYSETIMGAVLTALIDHDLSFFVILGGSCVLIANGIVALKPVKKRNIELKKFEFNEIE